MGVVGGAGRGGKTKLTINETAVSVRGRLRTADCGLQTADQGKCRLQTESKTQAGVKSRPNINCSRGRV